MFIIYIKIYVPFILYIYLNAYWLKTDLLVDKKVLFKIIL